MLFSFKISRVPLVYLLVPTCVTGESLESLRGSRTGVYIGVSSGEFEMSLLKNYTDNDAYVVQGGHHSMFANWVSFFLDLRGKNR